ncbi:hypothetical protein BJ138DRAFT_1228847 [Hygrophoropsis aurantiaca]|uniref:Uncharacterized protein n=1 Tax=Hygrophoropsis aurantiaca TaxID=72124 RepID=A0ACB7ZWU8_9AGAM|nr:hypothetical protein BJ138DRAFT_1228847 [Hygrophoropsis aurantiaca]
MGEYSYSSNGSYTTASPGHPYTPPDNGISPPALYSLSSGELSSDSVTSSRHSRGSGTHSPASVHNVPYVASMPRSHRFNPIAPPAAKASRRKSKGDSDDEDDDLQPRRRDELRDGYRRLQDTLPISNQKSSKVSLLDRATTLVKYLEIKAQQLQTRLQQLRRNVNEALMLGTAEQRNTAAAAVSQQSQSSF